MSKRFWLATLAGVGLFILDRVTRTLAFGHGDTVLIPKILKSLPIKNFGVALGLNFTNGQISAVVISSLLLVVVIVLATQGLKRKNFYTWLSTNLIFLGAFSNLLDRVIYGSVRDFLKFSFWPTTNNIGDLMVTVGAIILIITYKPNPKKLLKH
ncbi:MAG: signal peptidase II [Patescibacteria group bacterium]|jgi:signal peptidase II